MQYLVAKKFSNIIFSLLILHLFKTCKYVERRKTKSA